MSAGYVARLRRVLLTAIAVLVFVALAGATYQGVATALERRRYPRPGGMVAAGGRQLHIVCRGDGAPTVVLEAPATGMSSSWGWVQLAVAETTRVCAYDRAGLGWSEAGDGGFVADNVPSQLSTVLMNAGEPPPFVVAGQGLGAAFATLYASQYPDSVAALVLIDGPGDAPGTADDAMPAVHMWPWLARAGVLRATRMLSRHAEGLPPDSAGPLASFLNRPDHLTRAGRELDEWEAIAERAAAAALPAHIPVRRVEVAGPARVALLTDQAAAAAATEAILAAVTAVRAGH